MATGSEMSYLIRIGQKLLAPSFFFFLKKSTNSVRSKKKDFLNASVIRRSIQGEVQGEEEASTETWAIGCWSSAIRSPRQEVIIS